MIELTTKQLKREYEAARKENVEPKVSRVLMFSAKHANISKTDVTIYMVGFWDVRREPNKRPKEIRRKERDKYVMGD